MARKCLTLSGKNHEKNIDQSEDDLTVVQSDALKDPSIFNRHFGSGNHWNGLRITCFWLELSVRV